MVKLSDLKKTDILIALFLLFICFYHVRNFFHYDPFWGYDESSHSAIIDIIAREGVMPGNVYGSSNPPLYYYVASFFYKLYPSYKIPQLLNLVLFLTTLFLLWMTLNKVFKNRYFSFLLVGFYSFLPLNLNYAYMVLNYNLSHFLNIVTLFLIVKLLNEGKEASWKYLLGFIVLTVAGLMTSLTSLASLLTVVVYLVFCSKGLKRLILPLVFTLGVFLGVLPYALQKQEQFGCILCTKHRVEAKANYLPEFYYGFDVLTFEKPFSPHHLFDGMWPLLYQTFFGDYHNYLVDAKYAKRDTPPPGMVTSGIHYLDDVKILKLRTLNYLGIPIAILIAFSFLAALFSILRSKFDLKNPKVGLHFMLLTYIGAYFMQLQSYIHNYPDYVNIHSGYLYPTVFAICILLVNVLNIFKKVGYALSAIFILFSLVSVVTFWFV